MKITIWAADTARAVRFYQTCFDAQIVRSNPHITELSVAGGFIAIHSDGEGKKTWTGLTLQVADVVVGAKEVVAAGGVCEKEPVPEQGEPPHLAMCEDTEGNQLMLTRARS
ncbi:MAG: VOC family protein [Verrucomicrobiota bacterium]